MSAALTYPPAPSRWREGVSIQNPASLECVRLAAAMTHRRRTARRAWAASDSPASQIGKEGIGRKPAGLWRAEWSGLWNAGRSSQRPSAPLVFGMEGNPGWWYEAGPHWHSMRAAPKSVGAQAKDIRRGAAK